ncbi:MAG: hypothetical protein JKY65_20295, partial [Planctomycetes bacterium]|nr:hypothetical protein [Planctomycetota bacterium]
MRRRDRLVRLAVGTLLFMGSLTVVVPIGLGRWDPAWLRLAPDVQLDMQQPNLEPGEVRHPFVVEQSDLQGRLRWRLSGAGLRGPSNAVDLLREQSVLEPRLELFAGPKGQTQLKGGAILLTAARARIRVLEAEGKRRVRLDLGPDLVLRQGDLELRGDSLVVWFDPERPTEFQLRAKDSLVITLRGAG